MSLVPSVEVTKGELPPFWFAPHPASMVGGLVAVMRKAETVWGPGRKATYVAWLVRYVAAACIPDPAPEVDGTLPPLPPAVLHLRRTVAALARRALGRALS